MLRCPGAKIQLKSNEEIVWPVACLNIFIHMLTMMSNMILDAILSRHIYFIVMWRVFPNITYCLIKSHWRSWLMTLYPKYFFRKNHLLNHRIWYSCMSFIQIFCTWNILVNKISEIIKMRHFFLLIKSNFPNIGVNL